MYNPGKESLPVSQDTKSNDLKAYILPNVQFNVMSDIIYDKFIIALYNEYKKAT